MHLEWALLRIGRAHRPTSTVETIRALYFDPSPCVFLYDGEAGAAPVIILLAAGHVKGRKGEKHRAIGGMINQEVKHNVATETAYSTNGPGNLEILGELKSELIVFTVEIGPPYSWSADLGTHPLPADHNPTVDRRNKESLVEFSADGSL